MTSIASPVDVMALGDSATSAVDAILDGVADRLAQRRLPEATYRLQFNRTFTFRDARELVPYLAALGVSDCYTSPYLKARPASMHGYDIVDHNVLNPEIGSDAEYDDFVRDLHFHGINQLLDVVPNHMGVAGDDNAWWFDVLENGPASPYASFFDIDWMPLKPDLANKVLLPILGDQFGNVLEDQQLVLSFEDGAFVVRHYDHRFPISVQSSVQVLGHRLEVLEKRFTADDPQWQEYQSILFTIGHLPGRDETDPDKVSAGRREKDVIRRRLAELCAASSVIREFINENVRTFNGVRGDPASFDRLDRLLLDQAYRLSYWRVAADEINFRRFFDINELAAICMERPEVFQATHGLILRLVAEGKVDGLRIDHPDGLYDPPAYLRRLQQARFLQLCRRAAGEQPGWEQAEAELRDRFQALSRSDLNSPLVRPLYVVVEKILEPGERLPADWPVHGTTGYDFLNALNGLFVDRRNVRAFDRLYSRFIRHHFDFQELTYQCKKLIMQVSMSSEISVLGHELDRISERNRQSRDFTLSSLTEAIREIIACFPVYRTYVDSRGVQERDRHYVELAVARARRRNPATSASIFDFVRDILLLGFAANAGEAAQAAQRRFVGKFQQVTGPVMAKGVEDTTFYIYNRLVSLNEVGGDPERFGTTPAAFHQQNLVRQTHWPQALLATATHDTKRGEDVRARINVLSEMPEEWKARLSLWSRWNKRKKQVVDGMPAPSRNDEYLLYQTLLGAWPFEPMSPPEREQFIVRIQQYMLKATHEAKVHTSWISPNEPYEKATGDFVAGILAESPRNQFLGDFSPFARQIAELGIWNSLAQTVLKLTSPGVPDLYQGTELFDLSLVDPDNRRPVDYALRRQLLEWLQERIDAAGTRPGELAADLLAGRTDGRIKLYLILQLLNFRREHPGLLTTGQYIPLEPAGSRRDHACAFLRKGADTTILVAVPRLVAGLVGDSFRPPVGGEIWDDTSLPLPDDLSGATFANILTGETLAPANGGASPALALAEVFRTFPVAVLHAQRTGASPA